MAFAFQNTPACFQGNAFQVTQILAADAALGATGSESVTTVSQTGRKSATLSKQTNVAGTATRARSAATAIGAQTGISAPGRIVTPALTVSAFNTTENFAGTERPTARPAVVFGGRIELVSESRQIGVRATTAAFGQTAPFTPSAVRMARGAAASSGARSAWLSPGNYVANVGAPIGARGGWLTFGGVAFQRGAFQDHRAFQTGIIERAIARPVAALGTRENTSWTPIITTPALPVSFAARGSLAGSLAGHVYAVTTAAVRAQVVGAPQSARYAVVTLGVIDDEVNRYRSDGAGHGDFPMLAALAAGARATSRPSASAGTRAGQTGTPLSTRRAAATFAGRENAVATNVVIYLSAASLSATQETFQFRGLVQIFTGFGLFGVRGGVSGNGRNAGTARATVGAAAPVVSGNGRISAAISRAIGARATLAGLGLRAASATAQAIGSAVAAAASARATQRPASSIETASTLTPGANRVTARPVAAVGASAGALASIVRLTLSASRIIALAAELRGIGNWATSGTAALGQRSTVTGLGRIITRPAVTLSGPQVDQLTGPDRLTARPIGVIAADAKIPANSNSLAAVAAQNLVARLATPSIVRLGRFAAASIIRAALAIAGRFNPALIDHGRGVTLANEHDRVRMLMRSTPRQRGLRNQKPRSRSLS